jgi:OmpA-OmpF porin, OOP family
MPVSLIESLQRLVTPDLISRSSTAFDESESSLKKGFSAAVPVVLVSVANRVEDPWFMRRVYEMVTSEDNDPEVLDDVSRLIGSGPSRQSVIGHEFMSLLSGGRTERLGHALGRFAGLRPSTAAALLTIVAPMVLGLLGRTVRKGNFASGGLTDLLRSQRAEIEARMPGGLTRVLSEFGGFGEGEERPSYDEEISREYAGRGERPYRRYGRRREMREERGTRAWRWIVPAALVAGGIWALSAMRQQRERVVIEAEA